MINAIATKAISQAFDKSLKDAVLPFTGSRKGFGGDGGVYDPISDTFVNPTGETGDITYQGRGVFRQTLLRQRLRLSLKPHQLARLMLIVIGW